MKSCRRTTVSTTSAVCLLVISLLVRTVSSSEFDPRVFSWTSDMLESQPPFSDNVTLEEMRLRHHIEYKDWGCLFGAQKPHDGAVNWNGIDYPKEEALRDNNFMRGTTFWISEHMAVGHMMYDVFMLMVLALTKVDRVVIQRAPCANADLCMGVGTWDGWFRGFYTAIIDAFQPGIPVFLRWTWQEKVIQPLYLAGNTSDGYWKPAQKEKDYILTSVVCLERVIRRFCMFCFFNSVSPKIAAKFKVAAYKLSKDVQLVHHFTADQPIVVLLAHRGYSASRHIENIEYLISTLRANLRAPAYEIRVKNTTNIYMTFQEQLQAVAQAQVVIAEHGAFQSNLVFMRKGSLFVEMRGVYKHGEFKAFEEIARMFGVYYSYVNTTNLDWHRTKSFKINETEVDSIVKIVHRYKEEAPYKFNMRTNKQ